MRTSVLVSVLAIAAASGAAQAQVWAEVPDATALPPGQVTLGVGPLIDITGTLTGAGDVDMYCIEIFAPTSFGAWANPAFPPGTIGPAGAAFDSQLWLFRDTPLGAEAIMHSDDTDVAAPGGSSLQGGMGFGQPNPLIGPPPLGGSLLPGRYMIAISQFDVDALDPAGTEIWADVPFGGWSGPDGLGAPFLGGWTGGGAPGGAGGGTYHIVLHGAFFCDVPAPSSLALLGLAGVVASRRRR